MTLLLAACFAVIFIEICVGFERLLFKYQNLFCFVYVFFDAEKIVMTPEKKYLNFQKPLKYFLKFNQFFHQFFLSYFSFCL
jgi:hypothetical protein